MSWKVRISKQAREDLDQLRAYDQKLYSRALEITRSIEEDPAKGYGVPRPAPVIGPNVWYRRLSLEHRLVYEVFEDEVIIASYRTHYE